MFYSGSSVSVNEQGETLHDADLLKCLPLVKLLDAKLAQPQYDDDEKDQYRIVHIYKVVEQIIEDYDGGLTLPKV